MESRRRDPVSCRKTVWDDTRLFISGWRLAGKRVMQSLGSMTYLLSIN